MSSYIDRLLNQLSNPDVPPDPLDELMVRWNKLPQARRDRCIHQARVMAEILAKSGNTQHLGPGVNRQALADLGIRSRMTLSSYIHECAAFRAQYPDAPLALALVNMAGRPKRTVLTPYEQLLAIGAYAYTDWQVLIDEKTAISTKMKLQVEHVYSLLVQIFPETRNKINARGLHRFLNEVVDDDQALFTLAWKGEKAVWAEFLIKLPNTVGGPNERWQSDARALPIYILTEDGKPSTVTLVSILEEFSGIVPEWDIVERIEVASTGEKQRVDFRRDHICLLLARAMLKLKVCPRFFYTDNGSQYVSLKELIPYLTNSGDEGITPIFGFPGHPWGRGKIEVMQKLVDTCLHGLPGFVEDEDDPRMWEAARKAAKLTKENLRKILKRFFKQWNTDRKNGQPSRQDLWKGTKPECGIPMPEPERLFHLAFNRDWTTRKVFDSHIEYNNEFYRLKNITDDSRMRWIEAVNHPRAVWSLDYENMDGRYVQRVYACLDGRTFDELTPTSEQRPPAKQRVKEQQTDLNALGRLRSSLATAFLALLRQHDASIGTIAVDTVEKTTAIGIADQNIDTTSEQDDKGENSSNTQQHIDQPAVSPQEDDARPISPAQNAPQLDDGETPANSRTSYIEIMRQKREQRRNNNL
jgi:transposase InsO family protein